MKVFSSEESGIALIEAYIGRREDIIDRYIWSFAMGKFYLSINFFYYPNDRFVRLIRNADSRYMELGDSETGIVAVRLLEPAYDGIIKYMNG